MSKVMEVTARAFAVLSTVIVTSACSDAGVGAAAAYKTTFTQVADTVVAKTIGAVPEQSLHKLVVEWSSGGAATDSASVLGDVQEFAVAPDGRLVVWDQMTPTLWLYDAAGKMIKRISRTGGGPGEYGEINGVTVRPDGKIVVWDGSHARLNVYDRDGAPITSWPVPVANTFSNSALASDNSNRVWMEGSVRDAADPKVSRSVWFRWDSSGAKVDTVFAPDFKNDPYLRAVTTSAAGTVTSMSSRRIPFGRYGEVATSPFGVVVVGHGDGYVVHTEANGKPVRIEREYVPVPLADEHRTQLRTSAEFYLRRAQPDWKWIGPDIPKVKPPYSSFSTGLDGRIWVQLHLPSEHFELPPLKVDQANASQPPAPRVSYRTREYQWDVFEAGGQYLGRVVAPLSFSLQATRGDVVWGVSRDEDDTPSLVKMRIDPPFSAVGPASR